jgi:hypothetical protein
MESRIADKKTLGIMQAAEGEFKQTVQINRQCKLLFFRAPDDI